MKKLFWFTAILISVFILFNASSCSYHSKVEPKDLKLKLRWVKSYESESWADVRTGLIWAFSYLGAKLPSGSFDKSVYRSDENHFTIDFNRIGFSENAQKALVPILNELILSQEYQTKNGIDVGRFLMFTLYSSWHYYAITDIKAKRQDFEIQYFRSVPIEFRLSNSGVSKHQRLIRFSTPLNYNSLAFMGEEGTGNFEDNTFKATAFETIDLMENGQLRFGIYDQDGNLKTAADSILTIGGKPGKCQWCHEKTILPLYYPSSNFSNSISRFDFVNYVSKAQQFVDSYRKTLQTDIIYQNAQDHHFAELLYISFLEPSAERLSAEWGISKDSVLVKLAGFETHTYPEYPFLGNLYDRKKIQHLAPYQSVVVPESAREHSEFEPQLVGKF